MSVTVVGPPGPGAGNAQTGGQGAGGAGAGSGGGGSGQGQNNKPCACSKAPSDENRRAVNEKDDQGNDPKCPVCQKTGPERQAEEIAKLDRFIGATSDARLRHSAQMLRGWWSLPEQGKLRADHIVPASAIKKRKDFRQLEKTDLEGARKVMTAQTNMRGLCLNCNSAKGAKTAQYLGISDQTYFDKLNEIGGLIRSGGNILH